MYAYAWKQGLKTTYYLRSRPATRIARAAGSLGRRPDPPPSPCQQATTPTARTAVACSLENPESCEACQ